MVSVQRRSETGRAGWSGKTRDAAQSGSLRFTGRMTRVLTAPLKYQIQRALREFPELESQHITVGLTRSSGVHGIAYAEHRLIRLHVRRGRVSSFTIGHELTHLLQTLGQSGSSRQARSRATSGPSPGARYSSTRNRAICQSRAEERTGLSMPMLFGAYVSGPSRSAGATAGTWCGCSITSARTSRGPLTLWGRKELRTSPTPDLGRSGLARWPR